MKTATVGEIQTNFAWVLSDINNGYACFANMFSNKTKKC